MGREEHARNRHGALRDLRLTIRMLWYAPMLCGLVVAPDPAIDADATRWAEITASRFPDQRRLRVLALLAAYREFRTLYCYRLRRRSTAGAAVAALLLAVYPGERTLHLVTSEIGPGLFIQHGFATIVAARRVGANCWINQQVTIGFDRPDARPVLGDGVTVHAGAKVLGAITIGDGARIGANAVVLDDVPAGCTAVGVPARVLPPKDRRG